MDISSYVKSRQYTDLAMLGLTSIQVDGCNIILTLKDGKTATVTLPTPSDGADGISIKTVAINPENHLICTMSDNNTIDAGYISTIKGEKGDQGKDGENAVADYLELEHKPSINGVELKGNKTADELGLVIPEITVPSRLSEFQNDTNFVDRTYAYPKADTYSKAEVDDKLVNKASASEVSDLDAAVLNTAKSYAESLFHNITGFHVEIVSVLPSEQADTHTIYFLPKSEELNNHYDEYIWINNSWEHIGSTSVDLNGYYSGAETDAKLSGYYEKSVLDPLLDQKVDAVSGKGLSAEDYTTSEKLKLAGIEEGATNTIVENSLTSDSTAHALSASQGKLLKESMDSLEDSVIAKADKSVVLQATLSASGWIGATAPYRNTISVPGATSDNIIEVIPTPDMTAGQAEAFQAAQILNGSQAAGSITANCWGDVPTIDLPVTVIVRGDVSCQ